MYHVELDLDLILFQRLSDAVHNEILTVSDDLNHLRQMLGDSGFVYDDAIQAYENRLSSYDQISDYLSDVFMSEVVRKNEDELTKSKLDDFEDILTEEMKNGCCYG